MISTKVADRYAKALLIFSQEVDSVEIVMNDLNYVSEILRISPQFASLTANPIIRPTKKIEIFQEIFKNKISDITLNFFILLIKKNREDIIKFLIPRFIEQYNKLKNRVHAEIFTAKELSENLRTELCNKIGEWTGKEIIPKFIIDSRIIGGFQVKFDDYFYDASVKKHLDNLLLEISK